MLIFEKQIAMPPRLGATLRGALEWWFGELAALVPAELRRVVAPHRARLHVVADEREIALVRQTGGNQRVVGRLPAVPAAGEHRAQKIASRHAENAVICLPASHALKTVASLPLAAESNLDQVVAFEFERLVPFRRTESYFAYRVISRDRGTRSLRIELAVAPRAELDRLTRLAESAGYRAVAVEVAGTTPADPAISIPLAGDAEAGRSRAAPIIVGTAALALVLALACLAIPYIRTQNAVDVLTSEVARARRRADTAFDLRKRIERQLQAQTALARRRNRTPTIAEVLDTVTHLTPDGTWLTDLRIDGSRIQLTGLSPSASHLLRLIDRSPRFRDAGFASPVTREGQRDRERFSISAQIVPKETK